MNYLPSSRILLFTLFGIVVLCAALLGYRFGADSQRLTTDSGSVTTISTAQQSQALQQVTHERDVANTALQHLQQSLADAGRLTDKDKAELDLYRRIASDSTPGGLSIDNVIREEEQLAITLIQSRGRKAVNGVVKVAVTRVKDDKTERLIVPASTGENETEFDFRFFETINIPVLSVDGFAPQLLEITVSPNGEACKEFTAEFDWEDVIRQR